MVDVSEKPVTARRALASAEVRVSAATIKLIKNQKMPKGDVLAVARIAGIQAAKKASELIPLCHPLPIDAVDVAVTLHSPGRIRIEASVTVQARTGVEMEAMTAVSVAALAVYDMCKSVDRGIVIGPVQLEEKSGGQSGGWRR
ncbi:MAG: cyclic pyranopterin monophosphate synthase MoaC [Planctomycetes bacterium]|nr:cyclic pyranopterin monophosphate synthase MoaC [Planctomycetota bacterium]